MAHYHRSAGAPRCMHNAAIWAAYHVQHTAEYDEDRVKEPEYADGNCDACRAILLAPGAIWPPDLWEHLHATAAADYSKGLDCLKPYKLPPAIKDRTEKAEKWLSRILADVTKDGAKVNSHRANEMIGAIIGPDPVGGSWFKMLATDGSTALLERAPKGSEKRYVSIASSSREYLDLPPAFHSAVRRVRLLSSDRTGALYLEYSGGSTLRVHTRCYEGEASETIDVIPSSLIIAPLTVCLAAKYLELAAGRWPLRWYLNRSVQKTDAPDRWNPNPKPYEEVRPQPFEPQADDIRDLAPARLVIMPMRI